eukprot:GHVN01081670.1.p1 GENE.GHVN01081670.1~~GHVN01081670.1.p1  ORF type:complete len:223 (-),score=23.26 GHVN01081670.1:955-1623(-)
MDDNHQFPLLLNATTNAKPAQVVDLPTQRPDGVAASLQKGWAESFGVTHSHVVCSSIDPPPRRRVLECVSCERGEDSSESPPLSSNAPGLASMESQQNRLSLSEEDDLDKIGPVDMEHYVHIGCTCGSCGITPVVGALFRCVECTSAPWGKFFACLNCVETGQDRRTPGRFDQQHRCEHTLVPITQSDTPAFCLVLNHLQQSHPEMSLREIAMWLFAQLEDQ